LKTSGRYVTREPELLLTRRHFLKKAAAATGAGAFSDRVSKSQARTSIAAPDRGTALIIGRVLEAETQQVIPCTVTIRTSSGTILTEHPSFTGGFRSNGQFEKVVPPGEAIVTVSRGFDYVAVERRLHLPRGERLELTFELHRRTPLRRRGWYCGDNHVHMIHGEEKITVDFPYVALAARAEGLDYMSLAQRWNLPRSTPEQLEAACNSVSTPDFQLVWNMEAPKNYWRGDVSKCLGHGWTLAMGGYTADGKDATGELMGMSAGDYESDETSTPNFESHQLIHSLGGIVSYTHPCRWWWGKWGGEGIYPLEERKFISNLAQELPYDTVVGPTYDTIDILMQPEEKVANERAQELWFLLLNQGYRLAATASSDTTFDNQARGVPGRVRVYTRVEGQPSITRIAAAMRSGRNFVTSGPLLLMEINGYQIGDVVRLDKPLSLKGKVEAWAQGAIGEYLTKVEVISNGRALKTFDILDRKTEFIGEFELSEGKTAWYVARCYGSSSDQIAVTNPIYFETPDYRPPQPISARVTAKVTDKETLQPLAGTCEVIKMVGRIPVKQSEHEFQSGTLALEVPGTARLRVRVPGYIPTMKSIFMDYPPLLNLTLSAQSSELLDWRTFEEIRALLNEVRLEFSLARAAAP
jgi:hypothetical protein